MTGLAFSDPGSRWPAPPTPSLGPLLRAARRLDGLNQSMCARLGAGRPDLRLPDWSSTPGCPVDGAGSARHVSCTSVRTARCSTRNRGYPTHLARQALRPIGSVRSAARREVTSIGYRFDSRNPPEVSPRFVRWRPSVRDPGGRAAVTAREGPPAGLRGPPERVVLEGRFRASSPSPRRIATTSGAAAQDPPRFSTWSPTSRWRQRWNGYLSDALRSEFVAGHCRAQPSERLVSRFGDIAPDHGG